jgi:hypothetical protein
MLAWLGWKWWACNNQILAPILVLQCCSYSGWHRRSCLVLMWKQNQLLMQVVLASDSNNSWWLGLQLEQTLKWLWYTVNFDRKCFLVQILSFWFGGKQKQVVLNFTEQACIQEVVTLNLNQDMGYPDWNDSWFSSLHPGKCHDITSIRP